ncbi:uncharacterized protein LOC144729952 [Lampetra planeri]
MWSVTKITLLSHGSVPFVVKKKNKRVQVAEEGNFGEDNLCCPPSLSLKQQRAGPVFTRPPLFVENKFQPNWPLRTQPCVCFCVVDGPPDREIVRQRVSAARGTAPAMDAVARPPSLLLLLLLWQLLQPMSSPPCRVLSVQLPAHDSQDSARMSKKNPMVPGDVLGQAGASDHDHQQLQQQLEGLSNLEPVAAQADEPRSLSLGALTGQLQELQLDVAVLSKGIRQGTSRLAERLNSLESAASGEEPRLRRAGEATKEALASLDRRMSAVASLLLRLVAACDWSCGDATQQIRLESRRLQSLDTSVRLLPLSPDISKQDSTDEDDVAAAAAAAAALNGRLFPEDCADIYKQKIKESGVYTIQPASAQVPFEVRVSGTHPSRPIVSVLLCRESFAGLFLGDGLSQLRFVDAGVSRVSDMVDNRQRREDLAHQYLKRKRLDPLFRFLAQIFRRLDTPLCESASAFCDMDTDGGGWTVFQRRRDGSRDFNRTWADYKRGFGEVGGEHWLGNDRLHQLTRAGDDGPSPSSPTSSSSQSSSSQSSSPSSQSSSFTLRVELEDWHGVRRHALYAHFHVASERERYRLTARGYRGDAGNALSYSRGYNHDGRPFSTPDRDNDAYAAGNCAAYYASGWWFDSCLAANLNGRYHRGGYRGRVTDGIYWGTWYILSDYRTGRKYSFRSVEMKVRPARF